MRKWWQGSELKTTIIMDKINIAEILQDKSQGTKLYSPICGDVWLVKAEKKDEFTDKYPITVSKDKDVALNTLGFMKHGQYTSNGECLLFPSKEMRDWEKFAWKRGDVLMDNYGIWCMFNGWTTDDFTQFYSNYSITIDPSNEQTFYEDKVFCTKEFRKVGVNAAKDIIADLEKHYKGKFNPETLEIEKTPQVEFKDGDIVYVETKNGYKIVSTFQKFSELKKPIIYVSLFLDDNDVLFAIYDTAFMG